MDKPINLLYLLLLCTLASSTTQAVENTKFYEPVENICQRCICPNKPDDNAELLILDCTTKQLKSLVASWPDRFGTNHTGREIIYSMSGNEITTLPQLPETEALLIFTCRHCSITQLDSAVFMDVPNILRLDLSWNKLIGDALRADIFRGRYNQQEYEPIRLQDIDLSHNQIGSLPENLFEHVSHLTRLLLNNNPFGDLDLQTTLAISSVHKMEHLDLSFTGMTSVSDTLFQSMPNLKELLLQGNRLASVPESLAQLGGALKYLYIGGNEIQKLNDESFLGLNHLIYVNISGMPSLESIGEGTFVHLAAIEVITCKNNANLSAFDLGSLKGLAYLRELDISNCGLKSLNMNMVEVLTPNDEVSLDDNFNNGMEFSKIRSLKLEGNPWHCDCLLFRSLSLLEHHGSHDFHSDDEARCNTPYELSGTLLTDLTAKKVCVAAKQVKAPKIPIYEPPPFLRPRNLFLSVLSVCVVIAIGTVIGFAVVCIKRKLKHQLAPSPIRYTTVSNRHSTTSTTVLQP